MTVHVDITSHALKYARSFKNYTHYGYWWANTSIELVKIGSRVFALNGWDGESFKLCWECQNYFPLDGLMAVKNKNIEYNLRPVYMYQLADLNISMIKKDSREWEQAHEIIRFVVMKRLRARAKNK